MYFQFVVLTWNVIAIFICILQCSFWTSYIIWYFLILSHKPTTAPSSSSLHTILHSSSSTQNQIPNGTAWRPAGEGNSPPPDFLSTWGAVPSLLLPPTTPHSNPHIHAFWHTYTGMGRLTHCLILLKHVYLITLHNLDLQHEQIL